MSDSSAQSIYKNENLCHACEDRGSCEYLDITGEIFKRNPNAEKDREAKFLLGDAGHMADTNRCPNRIRGER